MRPPATPFAFRRRHTLVAAVAIVMASACGLVRQSTAPELMFEGVRQVTDDTFHYEYPSWSPDGKTIAVWRNTSNRGKYGPDDEGLGLALVDVSSGELKVIAGPGYINYPSWSPNGDELAVMIYRPSEEAGTADGRFDLGIFSTIDEAWRFVRCDLCGNPSWLVDGTILVSANLGPGPEGQRQHGTARVDPINGRVFDERPYSGLNSDLDTTSPSGEVTSMGNPFTATRDGTILLMTGIVGVNCSGIWVYALDSEGPVPLIDSPDLNECDPAMSHDETRIAYTTQLPSDHYAPTALVVANSDGSSGETLLEPARNFHIIRYPAWSPDGTQIAFVYGDFQLSSPIYSTLYIVDVPAELRP